MHQKLARQILRRKCLVPGGPQAPDYVTTRFIQRFHNTVIQKAQDQQETDSII